MKKRSLQRISIVLLALVLTMTPLVSFTLFAQEAPQEEEQVEVEYHLPASVKVGEYIPALPATQREVVLNHLEPGRWTYLEWDNWPLSTMYFDAHGTFGFAVMSDETGRATFPDRFQGAQCFYAPGPVVFQARYAYVEGEFDDPTEEEYITVGDPFIVTVEEPVIETNAPASIQVGEHLHLETALTNTALTNKDVAYYLDPDNYRHPVDNTGNVWMELIEDENHSRHEPAYQPKVEILEGQDLVAQANQDYTNTLHSSEDLIFTGTGTVKLKVTYQQFATCSCMTPKYQLGGVYVPEQGTNYQTYSPEQIITIQVTEDGQLPDKTDLENLVKEYGDLQAGDYTADTYQKFADALDRAAAVLADPDASQQEIDEALLALREAHQALKLADQTTGEKPPEDNPPTRDLAVPDLMCAMFLLSGIILAGLSLSKHQKQ